LTSVESVDNPDLKKSLIALAGGNVVELDSVIFEFDNSYSWWTVSELNGLRSRMS